jgi:hypothetical protein
MSARRAAALIVCTLLGAALNVYRAAYFVEPTVWEWKGFHDGPRQANGEAAHEVRSYASIICIVPDWRPLRLQIALSAPQAQAGHPTDVLLEAEHTSLGRVQVGSAPAVHEIIIHTAPSPLRKLTLEISADVDGSNSPAVDVGDVVIHPVMTPLGIARYGTFGALVGALACFLLVPPRALALTRAAPADQRQPRVALAIVFGVLVAYFGAWALLRPPMVGPDEPQHLMRAMAILKTPWVAHNGTFPHDPRFLNPLALWHPPQLWKVILPSASSMTREDVAAVKRAAWKPERELQHLETYRIALASYPPLYYWTVFAGGQLATSLGGLSPYQSSYAYRFASLLLSAMLWVVVYRLLSELFDRATAIILFAFLLLNPMIGYLASTVTADAAALPLAAIAILACWRTLSTGTHARSATLWLLAGAFVKPSGLQVIATIACATLLLALMRKAVWRNATPTLIALGRAGLVAWVLFYAWSPTIFVGEGFTLDLPTYVLRFIQRVPTFWLYFWGLLGWMDYKLPDIWYQIVAGLVLLNAFCLWWRPGTYRDYAIYALLVFFAFTASTAAGEFLYLHDVGYVIQGRYFLPALIACQPPASRS